MKKCAFFDIDYTIYDGCATSSFCLFLANRDLIPEFVYKKNKRIQDFYFSGKIDYAETVNRIVSLMAQALKNKDKRLVDTWQREFIKKRNRFFPWVEELFLLLKKEGYEIYLISAGASPPIEAVADFLGIKNVFSSKLSIKKGFYTGKIEKISNYKEKKKLIQEIVSSLEKSKKIGFGDSEGDVDMLSCMDVAFLYNPQDKKLIKLAKDKGWHIVDKNSILNIVKSKI